MAVDKRKIAVAIVMDNVDGDQLLMGYHNVRAGWEFPGGGVKPGETLAEAAEREAAEETGSEVEGPYKVLGVLEHDPEWLCVVVGASPVAYPTELKVLEPGVHREWAWVDRVPTPLSVNGMVVTQEILKWRPGQPWQGGIWRAED